MARNATQFLIDAWHGDGSVVGINDLQESGENGAVLTEALDDLSEGLQHQFDPSEIKNVDYGRLWMETYPAEFRDRVRSAPNTPNGLREAALEIQGSAHDQYYTRCTQNIFQQLMCPQAPYGTEDCFDVIDRPCSDQESDRQVCQVIPLRVDPKCDVGIEGKREVHWVGPSGKFCIKFPQLCETHIGYALNRSVYECRPGAASFLQDIMENGIIDSLRYQDELFRIRLMFGLDAVMDCAHPFYMDGTRYTLGYQASTSGYWTNVLGGAEWQLSNCDQSVLCAIEQIWEDAKDPFTCKPSACEGDFQLAIPRRCKIQDYQSLISAARHRYLNATTQDCNADIEREVGAREGWNSTVKYSQYMYDELVTFYLNNTFSAPAGPGGTVDTRGPAANQATAEYWAANTYLVSKSFPATFGMMRDYDIRTEELSGTNTQQYFDDGIMMAKIFSYKRTPGWKAPWHTTIVYAFDVTDTDITA